ncbi:MAG: AI-2E family transporter [Clostridia bacterium]|nr:AI-2E family transporter [Clostridia bacterium]
MSLDSKKRRKFAKWIIGIVAACILIFLGVQNINVVANAVSWVASLVMPLILGFVLALVINVPMRFFESHILSKTQKPFLQKLRRPIAYIISLFLILGIIVGVVWLVIPELVSALKVIALGMVDYIERLNSLDFKEFAKYPVLSFLEHINWANLLKSAQDWFENQSSTIVNTAFNTISGFVGGIFNLIISIIFSIYIIFSKEKLKRQSKRVVKAWIPEKAGNWMIHACSVANENFRKFVAGQTLEALILGVLCTIGMLILRIPYAPMVGALVGVTALVPVVGGFVGAIVGGFMILTEDPVKALIFIIFIIVLQQLEGNLIYPKVMGSSLNLPAMWILAAVTIGGGLAGPVGMLLSVPIASTAYILFREATEQREEKALKKSSKKETLPEKTQEGTD